jgi:dihydroorotate dehydrogenase electron transfer subunit
VADGLHRSAKIAERVVENAKTVTLVLEASLECIPGQFAMLWLPGMDEKPFSISGDDPLCFTLAKVGPVSEALLALAVGDRVWFRGPFGAGYSAAPGSTLLVGGGYGAAPLHFLARRLREAAPGSLVHAVLGARTSADIFFVERFAARGIAVELTTEDGSAGTRGRVTDVAGPLLAAGGVDSLCACGPEGMLDALAALCAKHGVAAQLSHEAYMRCGIGLCGSCEHGGRLVCSDGPVFRLPARA